MEKADAGASLYYYPLSGVVEHLLPGRVKLTLVIFQQPLLSERNGLFGSTQHLRGPLKVLSRPLSLQLCLRGKKKVGIRDKGTLTVTFRRCMTLISRLFKRATPASLFRKLLLEMTYFSLE